MRSPEESRIKSKISQFGGWSIEMGDYVSQYEPDAKSIDDLRKSAKTKKIILNSTLFLVFYGFLLLSLKLLTLL